jgi:hypothetical protein
MHMVGSIYCIYMYTYIYMYASIYTRWVCICLCICIYLCTLPCGCGGGWEHIYTYTLWLFNIAIGHFPFIDDSCYVKWPKGIKCNVIVMYMLIFVGWWFGTCFIFPYIGNNNPNWLIFFSGVETTNQLLHSWTRNQWSNLSRWEQST